LAGEIYFRLRDREKASSYYAKCAEIRETELKQNPDDFQLLGDLAQFYSYYGNVYLSWRDPPGALPHYDRAVQLGRQVVAKDNSVEYQRNLANALYGRGLAALRMSGAAAAANFFQECLKIRQELARKDPTSEEEKMHLMLSLAQCGRQAEAAAIAESVRVGREKDRELLITVARGYAECAATTPAGSSSRRHYEKKAIEAIKASVGQGYKDIMTLETAPDLEPLREHPDFVSMIREVKAGPAVSEKSPP
jgi:tetratricopeptide (TPR) repeat protein